jgi:hypothetical protein
MLLTLLAGEFLGGGSIVTSNQVKLLQYTIIVVNSYFIVNQPSYLQQSSPAPMTECSFEVCCVLIKAHGQP